MMDPTEQHDVGRFQTTQWSLILEAGQQGNPQSRVALAQLCEKYWYPLYCYARSRTGDPHAAQDLTQGFFAKVLEKNTVAAADPARGRFRTFLVTAFRNFMTNEWNKTHAQKRGGGRFHQSWDFSTAEDRYRREPQHEVTPELLFDRQWALAVLNQALERVRDDYNRDGRLAVFERLQHCLTVEGDLPSYAELAEDLGMSPGAVKVAVHRLRRRYRDSLREEILQTIGDQRDVEDEIERLFAAFSTSS